MWAMFVLALDVPYPRSFTVQIAAVAGLLFLIGLVVWWVVRDRSSPRERCQDPPRVFPCGPGHMVVRRLRRLGLLSPGDSAI